jgi:hypothetical protein
MFLHAVQYDCNTLYRHPGFFLPLCIFSQRSSIRDFNQAALCARHDIKYRRQTNECLHFGTQFQHFQPAELGRLYSCSRKPFTTKYLRY